MAAPQKEVLARLLGALANCLACTTAFLVTLHQDRYKILASHGLTTSEHPPALEFALDLINTGQSGDTASEDSFVVVEKLAPSHQSSIGLVIRNDLTGIATCICVADKEYRKFDESARQMLLDFGSYVGLHTTRREAIDALLENKQHSQAIIDSALDCIIFMDSNGVITEFNPAAERTFGFKAHEIVGKKLADTIIPPEHRDAHARGMARYLKTKVGNVIGKRVELPAMRADGAKIDVELTITHIEFRNNAVFVGYLRDITVLKQERKSKKRLLAEFQSIFELSPDGFIAFSADGRVQYLNPALAAMFGVDRDQIRILSEEEFTSFVRDRSRVSLESISSNGEFQETDERIVITHPVKRHLSKSIRVLSDYSSDVEGKVAYFRDVTHEIEVNEAKSDFLSTAAHELRTPVASIYGFTELLLKRDFDDATRRDLLETIYRQTTGLISLINELLDLARIEAKRGKDFRPIVQPIVPLIQRATQDFNFPGDPRKLKMKFPKRSPELNVDTEKFSQALINVISNAYKYSPDGGEITLRVHSDVVDRRKWINITVTDSGMGMSPDQLARVFERFYRADASGKIPGTGLGMALVKEIIELQGGHVGIESEKGKGTEVTISLPEVTMSKIQSEQNL